MAAGAAAENKLRVFIVDDEPLVRQLIRTAAQKDDREIQEFGDVGTTSAALKLAHPDLIFLDLELGSSDAIEAFRAFADLGYRGPIQLVSGRGGAVLETVKAVGAQYGFHLLNPIPKPFGVRQIREVFDAVSSAAILRTDHDAPKHDAKAAPAGILTLNEALSREWLELWYQPKVDLRTGRMVGAEGLIRARHPEHGVLGPIAFLPGAGDQALARLTTYVIRTALRDWQTLEHVSSPFHLSVNVPASALIRLPIAQIIRQDRPASSAWPGLVLELTADQFVSNIPLAQEIAAQLKIHNVELSFDDFGQGYSSLATLRDLPFTSLKIDRSFVAGCATDSVKQDIIKSIVALARGFGCTVVAEGIESQTELEVVTHSGCEYGQGDLLGCPMTRSALVAKLAAPSDRICAA